jgi:hypothetical protein
VRCPTQSLLESRWEACKCEWEAQSALRLFFSVVESGIGLRKMKEAYIVVAIKVTVMVKVRYRLV